MAIDLNIYDKRFFANTKIWEEPSAKEVVQILIKYFHPQSVIDIGCGTGIYLNEFYKKGIKILGYDGSPAALKESLVRHKIKIHDLCEPLKVGRRFDLCLCIEVAEHLLQECSLTLVDSLVKLSDSIIFTAAMPGQGPKSIGHINEQPHTFWIDLFKRKNFIYQKKLTREIKREMKAKGVVWWVVKNLMIFKKKK